MSENNGNATTADEIRIDDPPPPLEERSYVHVVSEPATYSEHSEHSYFRDIALREHRSDPAATGRLDRHALERRVNPNRLTGEGGYFAPPLWLENLFATAPRPGREFLDRIPHFDLPFGVSSVNLPRIVTGTTVTVQPDLTSDAADTDITDARVTSPAVPLSGTADVALQLLEQSQPAAALDSAIFKDLTESYDANLAAQVYTGLGTANSQQFSGLLVLPGTNSITYSASAPTAYGLYIYLGEAVAKVGDNRGLPPEAWLMTTSRAAWLGASEDTSNRPLALANTSKSGEFDLLSYEVIMDNSVPVTLGAGGNQDVVLAVRFSDMVLLETPHRTSVMLDVLSGTLQARIQLRGYAAFLVRYPSAVTVVGGTGLVVQTSF